MIKAHQKLDLFDKPVFEKAIIVPPFRMKAVMANEACFYYVVTGDAAVISTHGRLPLEEENGIVLKCGTYLNEYLGGIDAKPCEAIAVHFYPEVLQMLYQKEFPAFLKEASKIQPVRFDYVRASELLANYIKSLQFYFENPMLVSEELLQLKLKELILLLAKTDKLDKIKHLLTDLFSNETVNFREVVENNLFSNLTVQELAELCHLSASSFKRRFRSHYQMSPAKYIRGRRLERAAELLLNSDLTISQVALACGFIDLAHFSKSFHKVFEMSPRRYRLTEKTK